MARFRNKLKERFSQIPNELIFDGTLSDRARFLYCYMSAKPDNWEFFMYPMSQEIGYTVDTLRKYIKELICAGWLSKYAQQKQSDGTFGANEYVLEAEKINRENQEGLDSTVSEKTRLGKNHRHNNTIPSQRKKYKSSKEDYIQKNESDSLLNQDEIKTTTKSNRFNKPTIDDIQAYCQERKNNIDPEQFMDHYTAVGWVVGKSPMKCWKAAIRQWERNQSKFNPPTQRNPRTKNQLPYKPESEIVKRAKEKEKKAIKTSTP